MRKDVSSVCERRGVAVHALDVVSAVGGIAGDEGLRARAAHGHIIVNAPVKGKHTVSVHVHMPYIQTHPSNGRNNGLITVAQHVLQGRHHNNESIRGHTRDRQRACNHSWPHTNSYNRTDYTCVYMPQTYTHASEQHGYQGPRLTSVMRPSLSAPVSTLIGAGCLYAHCAIGSAVASTSVLLSESVCTACTYGLRVCDCVSVRCRHTS